MNFLFIRTNELKYRTHIDSNTKTKSLRLKKSNKVRKEESKPICHTQRQSQKSTFVIQINETIDFVFFFLLQDDCSSYSHHYHNNGNCVFEYKIQNGATRSDTERNKTKWKKEIAHQNSILFAFRVTIRTKINLFTEWTGKKRAKKRANENGENKGTVIITT